MADKHQIERAVEEARQLLAEHGIECRTTADELKLWFEADTLYPDITLDEVLKLKLIVVHEIVEISEVRKLGLELTKDVILKNLDAVDSAHLVAADVEMDLASKLGEANHMRDRLHDIEKWCVDESVSEGNRRKYRVLLARTKAALELMDAKARKEV